ncbi:hypothetical protein KIPB_002630 [Kipferlia bialata]|uniref:Uncharacterized protein n=1 Tax=Kipferlia bialata TaxID=797122 RepID=A0A9K3GGB6_9EUKA|nr:hypothetical protein KIPB_002630 [Kipferlia bialata]|eukprot:g2630.t1
MRCCVVSSTGDTLVVLVRASRPVYDRYDETNINADCVTFAWEYNPLNDAWVSLGPSPEETVMRGVYPAYYVSDGYMHVFCDHPQTRVASCIRLSPANAERYTSGHLPADNYGYIPWRDSRRMVTVGHLLLQWGSRRNLSLCRLDVPTTPLWLVGGQVSQKLPLESSACLTPINHSLVFCYGVRAQRSDPVTPYTPCFIRVSPEVQSIGARHLLVGDDEGAARDCIRTLTTLPHHMHLLAAVVAAGCVCDEGMLDTVHSRVASITEYCTEAESPQDPLEAAWAAGLALRGVHTAHSLPWGFHQLVTLACDVSPSLREAAVSIAHESLTRAMTATGSIPFSLSVKQLLSTLAEMSPFLSECNLCDMYDSVVQWICSYLTNGSASPTGTLKRCGKLCDCVDYARDYTRCLLDMDCVYPELHPVESIVHKAVCAAEAQWFYRGAATMRQRGSVNYKGYSKLLGGLCAQLSEICSGPEADEAVMAYDYSLHTAESAVVSCLCSSVTSGMEVPCLYLMPTISRSLELPALGAEHCKDVVHLLRMSPVSTGSLTVHMDSGTEDMGIEQAREWHSHLKSAVKVTPRVAPPERRTRRTLYGSPDSLKVWGGFADRRDTLVSLQNAEEAAGSLDVVSPDHLIHIGHPKDTLREDTTVWSNSRRVLLSIGHNKVFFLGCTGSHSVGGETLCYVVEPDGDTTLLWRCLPSPPFHLDSGTLYNGVVCGGLVYVLHGKQDPGGDMVVTTLHTFDIATETWSKEARHVADGVALLSDTIVREGQRILIPCTHKTSACGRNPGLWCYNLETGVETILPRSVIPEGDAFLSASLSLSPEFYIGILRAPGTALSASSDAHEPTHQDTDVVSLPGGVTLLWEVVGARQITNAEEEFVGIRVHVWDAVAGEMHLIAEKATPVETRGNRICQATVLSYGTDSYDGCTPVLRLLLWRGADPVMVTIPLGGPLGYLSW